MAFIDRIKRVSKKGGKRGKQTIPVCKNKQGKVREKPNPNELVALKRYDQILELDRTALALIWNRASVTWQH